MDGMSENGIIFVFTGTSGSGRKTIARLIGKELGVPPIISCTTRLPRPKEQDGMDYHFVARADFIQRDMRGEFMQLVEVDAQFYGTRKADVEDTLRRYGTAYVIVNRYGADAFTYAFGERAVRLFIYASKPTILERLQEHGTPQDIIDHYMNHYIEEVSYRKQCAHVFENLDAAETAEQVKKVMASYLPARTG